MAATRFPKDSGLAARMGITIFLIGLLYVVFVAVLIALKIPLLILIVIAGGLFFAQYFFSDRLALFSMSGKEVSAEQSPELHAIVDRLCALADMKKPRIAIANTDLPNAFATGRNQNSSVLCVTTGLLRRLNESELEGVLSHELSHVAHRDVAVMTIASFLGILAGIITRFAYYAGIFGGFGGGGGRGGRGGRGGGNSQDSPIQFELAIIAVSAIVYALSFVLVRTLSRYRELSADRSAAILTGKPSSLASALVKVSGDMARIPTQDLRRVEPMNAFFFTPALSGGASLSSLFSTHPSLEKRLEQLAKIETELGQAQ